MLRRFSREPYLKKQRERRLIQEGRKRFQAEQAERRNWKIQNAFDEAPRLDKWTKNKDKMTKQIESLILSSIGLSDGVQTAVTNISTGLGLRELDFDYPAVEDLSTNIYLVKLADLISNTANLREDDKNRVMQAVIGQLFPQPAPVNQAQMQRNQKTEDLLNGIEKIRAVRATSSRS